MASGNITFSMPRDSATCTVHNIKDPTWKWQPLGTHNSRYCWNSPFKGKLNLSFMFIFWCKRHCKDISFKKITTKAGNSTTYIQNHSSVLPPCNLWYRLQFKNKTFIRNSIALLQHVTTTLFSLSKCQIFCNPIVGTCQIPHHPVIAKYYVNILFPGCLFELILLCYSASIHLAVMIHLICKDTLNTITGLIFGSSQLQFCYLFSMFKCNKLTTQ